MSQSHTHKKDCMVCSECTERYRFIDVPACTFASHTGQYQTNIMVERLSIMPGTCYLIEMHSWFLITQYLINKFNFYRN